MWSRRERSRRVTATIQAQAHSVADQSCETAQQVRLEVPVTGFECSHPWVR